MAILKNVPMKWVKLDPAKPAAAFGDGGPKWEFQAETFDKAQAEEWKKNNLKVKLIEVDGKMAWKMSLRKPTTKKDGTANAPVKVVNGFLQPMDPNTIGNGSVCNARIFQYDYEIKAKDGKAGVKGISTMLMEVQVTKFVKYEPKQGEQFEAANMEIVEIADNLNQEEDDTVVIQQATAPKVTGVVPVDGDF